ncbi:MAG: o-succinylbenzoate--CoA ligase [Glaciihabitans sp.]|nr:o-succinylbenzoate--CoA ligase [Glaciihabitans sp.]
MRPLAIIPADPSTILAALRDALSGSGPAVLPTELIRTPPLITSATADIPLNPDGDGNPAHDHDHAPQVPLRIALVVETSGSTGRPKRVALSSEALLTSAAASDSVLGGPGQWLLALPVHYIAGLNVLVRSIAAGTDPVILPAGPFDPHAFASAAEQLDSSLRYTSLVPAQLGQLLDTPDALPALRRFDGILVGGQSTPAPLLERARELGLRIIRTYGSSETAGGCVYNGEPIGNTAVRIVDGQVELSGSVLADGYLDEHFQLDNTLTAEAFVTDHGQRWYRTNDAGQVDDGTLAVTGRLDDVIISGGLKVSLAAVESALRALPGQRDAVVVAAPSERWGEVPVVFTTTPADLPTLRAALSANLGRAAAPDRIIVLEQLPMLSSGKPDRRALRLLAK